MRQASELRDVDTILDRFPGPVTLTTSMRWKLTALVICLGFAAFCIYLLVTGSVHGWYDTAMAWLATALFGAFAIRALILLLAPVGASLTLDADGFEVTGIFRHARSSWRDVSGFRVESSDDAGKVPAVTFDVRIDGAGSQHGGATKTTGTLPGSYGLSDDDLARLMERWCERARVDGVSKALPGADRALAWFDPHVAVRSFGLRTEFFRRSPSRVETRLDG